MNYVNQHALVLGLGESGLAVARWLIYCGARLRVADTRGIQAVEKNLSLLRLISTDSEFIGHNVFSVTLLDDIDFIIVSPGLKPKHDLAVFTTAVIQRRIPIWSEIELFAQALVVLRKERAYIPKILAITGTNGKTTVASLTNMLCQQAGLRSVVAGNISPAILEVLRQELMKDNKQNKFINKQHKIIVLPKEIIKYRQLTLNFLIAVYKSNTFLNKTVKILDVMENFHKNHITFFPSKFTLPVIKFTKNYISTLPEVWILELSSFQLHSTKSLQADAATVLNITQDHLDWHDNMGEYIADKAKIFGKNTIRVLNRNDMLVMKMATSTVPVITFGIDEPDTVDNFGLINVNNKLWLSHGISIKNTKNFQLNKNLSTHSQELIEFLFLINRLIPVDALQIRGVHNAMNALAALALCQAIGLSLITLLQGLCDYTGQPHRIELVANIQGVDYYDDSKSTNVDATVAALNSFGCFNKLNRLLLIIGGEGKGQDFTSLIAPLKKYSRVVLLIGHNVTRIRDTLISAKIKFIDCFTLEKAVWISNKLAKTGDIVLLSPACGSLDMFHNYIHRAQVFITAVRKLALLSQK